MGNTELPVVCFLNVLMKCSEILLPMKAMREQRAKLCSYHWAKKNGEEEINVGIFICGTIHRNLRNKFFSEGLVRILSLIHI